MRRLVHEDLKMSSFTLQKRQGLICSSEANKMSPFTLQKRQALSAAVKQKKLERSKLLLKTFRSGTAGKIVWSDEKIFTVEMVHNRRNDRIIGRSIKDIPCNQKTVH